MALFGHSVELASVTLALWCQQCHLHGLVWERQISQTFGRPHAIKSLNDPQVHILGLRLRETSQWDMPSLPLGEGEMAEPLDFGLVSC